MIHFIQHWLGFAPGEGNDAPYLFWSGFFGDGPIFVAVVVLLWHHNCQHPGCPRMVRHGNKKCKRHSKTAIL